MPFDHDPDMVYCPFHGDDPDTVFSPKFTDPELGVILACGHSLAEVNERVARIRADLGLRA